jgi:hypothetical protein
MRQWHDHAWQRLPTWRTPVLGEVHHCTQHKDSL